MLKVLFILHYPNPFSGAAWARIGYNAKFIKNLGHKVTVAGVFSASTLDKAGSHYEDGIELLNITPIIMMQKTIVMILNIISSALSSLLVMVLKRPNIVVISVPTGETALGAYFAARVFRCKVFFDYRDEWEDHIISTSQGRLYKFSYRVLKKVMTRCYIKSLLVITVTEPFARSLYSRGVRNLKIVSNGADLSVFRPYDRIAKRSKLGLEKGDFIFVFSGTVGLYYRLDIVARAIQKLKEKNCIVKLLILGDGQDTKRIIEIAKEGMIQNQILHLGTEHDKFELAKILSCADVGIVPYNANPLWKNSIPVKALEYLACGLPVIATAFEDSQIGYLIRENHVGFICPPEDPDKLAKIMETILHYDMFDTYKKRSRTLVESYFNRENLAEEFFRLIST